MTLKEIVVVVLCFFIPPLAVAIQQASSMHFGLSARLQLDTSERKDVEKAHRSLDPEAMGPAPSL
ncbi:hypothetical protein RvY_14569 [Ramazzottius varieornatus]|uniref:Uncharacterized protein n=1 Tax=Ramazzottius varieornatus TaxID=947166 RepID=A0A1D1VTH4_RAMVA|nr:hypothetical protein RvY_14569 [Ramazzottius varieornatus]